MMATRRLWIQRVAMATFATLLVAGCNLTRPAPVKATYLLEPTAPAAVTRAHPGTVRMGVVNVGAPFRGRTFVSRESDLRYETDYYNEFFVPPAVNIADATARALSLGKVFTAVAPPGSAADAEWVLDAFVGSLYGDARDVSKPMAVIAVTYYLSLGRGSTSTPFWSRTYERRLPFTAGSTASYVDALNKALTDILAEMTRDVATVSLPAT